MSPLNVKTETQEMIELQKQQEEEFWDKLNLYSDDDDDEEEVTPKLTLWKKIS